MRATRLPGSSRPYYSYVTRGDVSGPLGKKTSIFGSGAYVNQQTNAVVNAGERRWISAVDGGCSSAGDLHVEPSVGAPVDGQQYAGDTV